MIATPIFEFFRLRKEIHICLIDFANIWPDEDEYFKNRALEATHKMRRLSAELSELDHSLQLRPYLLCKWTLKQYFKMDLKTASNGLMMYYNDFYDVSGVRTQGRDKIQFALKLPRTYSEETLNKILDKKDSGPS